MDGLGHLFAASNTGHLTFIDYTATGLINSGAFVSTQFLANFLDDVAPLSGAGSTGRVPEPATLALLGIGLMAIAMRRMRARKRA